MRHHNQICQPGLVGHNNVRFPPNDRGKASRGFVGACSRLVHNKTVLGCQPFEQVARGGFPISVGSGVQHGQVRAPQSCDHDCRTECGCCSGGGLQRQQNLADCHHSHSHSHAFTAEVPAAYDVPSNQEDGTQSGTDKRHLESQVRELKGQIPIWHADPSQRTCSNRSRHCEAT